MVFAGARSVSLFEEYIDFLEMIFDKNFDKTVQLKDPKSIFLNKRFER